MAIPSADPTAVDLSRLLSCLDKIILSDDTPESAQLKGSSLERGRATAVSMAPTYVVIRSLQLS